MGQCLQERFIDFSAFFALLSVWLKIRIPAGNTHFPNNVLPVIVSAMNFKIILVVIYIRFGAIRYPRFAHYIVDIYKPANVSHILIHKKVINLLRGVLSRSRKSRGRHGQDKNQQYNPFAAHFIFPPLSPKSLFNNIFCLLICQI